MTNKTYGTMVNPPVPTSIGPNNHLSTPKNKTQMDITTIRNTIERIRKEYAEKFPKSSNPSESLLNLTNTVHDEPLTFQATNASVNSIFHTSTISRSPINLLVDNTAAGPSAMVIFLDLVSGPAPDQATKYKYINKKMSILNYFPTTTGKRYKPEGVSEEERRDKKVRDSEETQ